MKSLLVIATPQGQLGNSLVHFAHIRAFAKRNSIPLVHCSFGPFAPFFRGTAEHLFCPFSPDDGLMEHPHMQQIVQLFKSFLLILARDRGMLSPASAEAILLKDARALNSETSEEMRTMLGLFGCAFVEWVKEGQFVHRGVELLRIWGDDFLNLGEDPRIQELIPRDKIILLDGWGIRDPESFDLMMNDTREYFRPLERHDMKAEAAVASLRKQCECAIGLHIRRGDYETYESGRYFWSIAQYRAFMRRAVEALPKRKVGFLICSNEKLAPSDFEGFFVTMGPGIPIEDMYALARCDYIMGPPSTFSMWACRYGNRRIVVIENPNQKFEFTR